MLVRDAYPDHGALGGIYTAIVTSPHERTLVVACDMPFLNRALLEYMAGIDADLVIPRTSRGYEPLCAVYSRACAPPILERVEARRARSVAAAGRGEGRGSGSRDPGGVRPRRSAVRERQHTA